MSDELRRELERLEMMKPHMGDTPVYFGQWLIEMADLQLKIARSVTVGLPEAQKTL